MSRARKTFHRITRRMINDALRARGRDESLYPADGYFYFGGGEAVHWLSSTVMVKHLSDLTLEQWLAEFDSLLKRQNTLEKQMAGAKPQNAKPKQPRNKPKRKTRRSP